MTNRVPILLAGGLGGMAPTLFKVGASLVAGNPNWGSIPAVCLGALIFGALGAGLVLVYKETDLAKAFTIGIGLPALLTAGAGGATSKPAPRENEEKKRVVTGQPSGPVSMFSLLSTPAFAEQGPVPAQVPLRPTELDFKMPPTAGGTAVPDVRYKLGRKLQLNLRELPEDVEVIFSARGGQEHYSTLLHPTGERNAIEVQIPDAANEVSFRSESLDLQSESFGLPQGPGTEARFSVGLQSQFLESLKKTLGFEQTKPVAFEVHFLLHPPPPKPVSRGGGY